MIGKRSECELQIKKTEVERPKISNLNYLDPTTQNSSSSISPLPETTVALASTDFFPPNPTPTISQSIAITFAFKNFIFRSPAAFGSSASLNYLVK